MGMAYREPKKQVVYHKDFDPAEKERDQAKIQELIQKQREEMMQLIRQQQEEEAKRQ